MEKGPGHWELSWKAGIGGERSGHQGAGTKFPGVGSKDGD